LELAAKRIGNADVGNNAVVEKRVIPANCSINDLIWHDASARRELLAETSNGTQTQQVSGAAFLEGVDIGSIGNRRR
jgi:hypothetical protein